MATRFLHIGAGFLIVPVTLLLSCSPSTAPSNIYSIVGETFVGTAAETINGRTRTTQIRFQFNYTDNPDQYPHIDIAGQWSNDSLGVSAGVDGVTGDQGFNRYWTRFLLKLDVPSVGGFDVLFGEGTFSGGYRRFGGYYMGTFHGDSIRASFVTRR